jgi:hypothetical protein
MRQPVISEPAAFRFTYSVAVVIGASLLAGHLLAPVWGIALFTTVALAALVWDLVSTDPDRRTHLTEAARDASAAARGRRRILVIANEALTGRALREELLRRGEPWPELQVVAPVLPSRSHYLVSDIDRERADARGRLDETVAWALEQGFEAGGKVGDLNDPLAAIGDELRLLGAEEVIVATHPPERANWLEGRILDHLRSEIDIPITHMVVDREHDRVEVEAEPVGARRRGTTTP